MHETREVADAELPFEFMLNALRLIDGFPVALFAQRTGLPIRRGAAAARGRSGGPHRARPRAHRAHAPRGSGS